MVYTIVNNIVNLNLNSIFNILNAITTTYRFLAYKTLNFGNWAPWFSYDFLKILTIWASFSYKLFSYKKTCNLLSKSSVHTRMYILWCKTCGHIKINKICSHNIEAHAYLATKIQHVYIIHTVYNNAASGHCKNISLLKYSFFLDEAM